MIIETERLLLEPWHQRHLEAFVELGSDAQAMRYIGSGASWTPEQSEERYAWHLDHWRRHGFGWRSAIDKPTGALLGFVGINRVRPEAIEVDPREVEIGWRFTARVTGRGLATEAAVALRDEGFGRVALKRLIARCQPRNVPSARVIKKIGMSPEQQAHGRHGEHVRIYSLDLGRWLALTAGECRPRVARLAATGGWRES